MTEPTDYIEAALQAWAPTYPRRVTKFQRWVTSIPEAVELIADAENDPENWPFISTYSFPRGHTKDGEVPEIDRIFFDFDVPDDGEYRSGNRKQTAWARDMSRLLVRTRKVARYLLESDAPGAWQVALSGHKGVHLDLTFPPVSVENGSYDQFRQGMDTFADVVIDRIAEKTGLPDLDMYMDVSSADLGRLRRVPNTKHLGASESFGEDRFCVPVTLAELAKIGPAEYIALTQKRRAVTKTMRSRPNEAAHDVLVQHIRNSSPVASQSGSGLRQSRIDRTRIQKYVERQNENIDVDDLELVLTRTPCIQAFIERDDAFSHRSASHLMEMFAITHMMEKRVPIEVEYDDPETKKYPRIIGGTMVDFFRQHDGFDKDYTCQQIEQYIGRAYKPVNCEGIWQNADQFCLGPACDIYQRSQTNRADR
jgi:hypothetical protein